MPLTLYDITHSDLGKPDRKLSLVMLSGVNGFIFPEIMIGTEEFRPLALFKPAKPTCSPVKVPFFASDSRIIAPSIPYQQVGGNEFIPLRALGIEQKIFHNVVKKIAPRDIINRIGWIDHRSIQVAPGIYGKYFWQVFFR